MLLPENKKQPLEIGEIIMRRMITEKDVEKLDNIKPSEIEKLGAMQDPKTATAGQILTADGKGKATYKTASSDGTKLWNYTQTFSNTIKQDASIGAYIRVLSKYGKYAISPYFFQSAVKSGDTTIPYSELVLMSRRESPDVWVYVLIPEATMTKYNLTVGSAISGNLGWYYYSEQ